MKVFQILSVLILSLVIVAASSAQNSTPMAAAKSFYLFHSSNSKTFSRSSVDARKKWFSPGLYDLFLNELKREKEFLKAHPTDKPYMGDGLPFQPSDEVCTAGNRSIRKTATFKPAPGLPAVPTVVVRFAFPSPCKTPDASEYKLEFTKSRKGWVINDVVYEDGSSLVKNLSRIEY